MLSLTGHRESARIDPLYLYPTVNSANALYQIGDSSAALPYVEQVLQLEPDNANFLGTKADTLADLDRLDEAREVLNQMQPQIDTGRGLEIFMPKPQYGVLSQGGETDAAETVLRWIRAFLDDPNTPGHFLIGFTIELVPFLVREGRNDVVIDLLTEAISRDAPVQLAHAGPESGVAARRSCLCPDHRPVQNAFCPDPDPPRAGQDAPGVPILHGTTA